MQKFKNDKERIAFLEDYRNETNGWYLWKELDDIQRLFWRLDLPGSALIVEEHLRTFTYPKKHRTWVVHHWYVIRDWERPFSDNTASRTMALARLKEEEKAWKD